MSFLYKLRLEAVMSSLLISITAIDLEIILKNVSLLIIIMTTMIKGYIEIRRMWRIKDKACKYRK